MLPRSTSPSESGTFTQPLITRLIDCRVAPRTADLCSRSLVSQLVWIECERLNSHWKEASAVLMMYEPEEGGGINQHLFYMSHSVLVNQASC